MRRKSERTVKSSPIKKPETPSRRSTRGNRKTTEKAIYEEESGNSSDQASSSENESEEVVAPKRSRRTSRTIEKSSSAEEVKATTTTRSRRRTIAKKDADIKEEDSVETEETANDDSKEIANDESKETANDESKEIANDEPVAEKVDAVDSSTEPTTSQDIAEQAESTNKTEQDDSELPTESNETANNKSASEEKEEIVSTVVEVVEAVEAVEAVEPVKVSEPVETIKPRKRALRRIERETPVEVTAAAETTEPVANTDEQNEPSSNENDTNQVENDELPNKSTEEVNSSENGKLGETNESPAIEICNTHISDSVDTTGKDTSETDTSSRIKKKPIVRKRKWLTNKTAAPKVQEITISTDSLKGLISDVKPVPLSDVQLDSSPEDDHESDDVKVVSSTSVDYNRRSEEHVCESTEDAVNISTSRKISVVTESEGDQPLSPAKHNPCNILYITNLVRPFTVLQLKSLLQRTGKITEDGFWIDKIKSKCFVKYTTEDEAVETRHALHGIRWPTSNPKCLNVDFGNENLMEKAVASTADEVKLNVRSRDDRIASSNDLLNSHREKATGNERPVREWDLGKKDSHRPREAERVERADRDKEREEKPREVGRESERDRERDRGRDRDRERERGDRRRRSASASPSRKFVKKDNEPPLRLLDDLFRKTKTTPCIYWLPLTPEQIAVRIDERKKNIERREALRKEREREDVEERNRRREREKRREDSRERRDKDRDRERERNRDDRDAGKRRRY